MAMNARFCAGVAVGAMLSVGPAFAQQTGAPLDQGAPATQDAGAAPASSGIGLQDIVVTAQRRSESLQKVPIAVTVVTSAQLASAGIADTTSISTVTPGLTVSSNGPSGIVYLRGVGSNLGNVNQEPSVAVYVDDVYIASPTQNQFSLNNIEQVAVLKGPQGTLFGRNATGGVIQITTRDPSEHPRLDVEAGYGNYDTVSGSLYATGPVAPDVAIDLAVVGSDQRNGWGRNLTRNEDAYKLDDFGARSKVMWTPGTDTTVRLSVDYSISHIHGYGDRGLPGEVNADGQPAYRGFFNTLGDTPSGNRKETGGASLKIEHDLNFARLVSITAYRKLKNTYMLDEDKAPIPIVDATLNEFAHNYSQELQLIAPKGSRVDWVAGLFLYDFIAGVDPAHIAGFAAAPLPYFDVYDRTKTKSGSLYAQATTELFADTRLTAGLRYTIEKQYNSSSVSSIIGVIQPTVGDDKEFKKPTWRLSLDHQFTPSVLGYISYNRGVKSGGYDVLSPGAPGYSPERLDAYEIGLKSQLFDNRLRFNVAGFYYNYKNIQEELAVVGGTVTINAAAAHLYGVDADLRAALTRHLTVYAAASYIHSEFTSFENAQAFPGNPGPATPDPSAVGNHTPNAPKFTGNIGADYDTDVSFGKLSLGLNYSYNDGFFWDSENRLKQPSYSLLNGSVGWTSLNGQLGVRVWAKNINNARYYASEIGTSGLGDLTIPAAPRTFGATVSVHY